MEPEPPKTRAPPLSAYFRRLEPGEAPPPLPARLAQWSSQTTAGIFLGMTYGGYHGLREARDPRGGPLDVEPSPFGNRRHRAAAYFVRGSILQGARIGCFVAVLSAATQAVDARLRGNVEAPGRGLTVDPRAVAAGAAGTCGLFGGVVGGLQGAVRAAAFGGLLGGGVGAMQSALDGLVTRMEADQGVTEVGLAIAEGTAEEAVEARQAVEDVVRWLETAQEERRGAEEKGQVSGEG